MVVFGYVATSVPFVYPWLVRIVYHQDLSAEKVRELEERGFEVVDLMTLPRETDDDKRTYLWAKAQAIDEGLCPISMQTAKVMELQMRALGMLGKRDDIVSDSTVDNEDSVEILLRWQPSRHTLKGNSTVQLDVPKEE